MQLADFDSRLQRARKVEIAVAEWCMDRGALILPAYDFSGLQDNKAPKLLGRPRSFVLPDLLCFRARRRWWAEVKFKTRADWTHVTGQWETGIDLRLWRHYCDVEKNTSTPVWLVFAHQVEDEVRAASLSSLMRQKPRESPRFNAGRGGIFFAWDSLHSLVRLTDLVPRDVFYEDAPS